jgi:uncharacterized protein
MRHVVSAALVLAAASTLVAGCAGSSQTTPVTQPAPAVQRAAEAVATAAPVLATAVSVPAPTVAPTAVPTPAPTATPHPLTIQVSRMRDYPGSDITIEQNLASGSNYSRQVVSYRSDGLKIYALLTVPNGPKPPTGWPVVVFNHGFIPPAVYRTTERYIAYTDAFSRAGYVLIRPDYRGHGSSEGQARGGYGNNDYVIDVLNAMSSVRRLPMVDPDRVGMWGHSMGGYITLRSMVISQTPKAGVIWGGVVGSYEDMLFNWFNRNPLAPVPGVPSPAANSWRRQLLEEYGAPSQNPAFWASISANTYVGDLSGPIQIHHGGADHEVPPEMSATLERQIRAVGVNTELYTYPGDDHDISRNLGAALSRSVQWFDRYVKNT